MPQPDPQPTAIADVLAGVPPALVILAGIQLDLFNALRDGPLRAEELATALGVEADKLARLLHALVAAGALTVEAGRFANTAEAAARLVRGQPGYLGAAYRDAGFIWRWMLQTAGTIRAGTPQARQDWATMGDADLDALLQSQIPGARAAGQSLAQRFDFAQCGMVADVAGGSGGLAIALAETCPHLQVTVIDLPRVVPIARRIIADAGATRVQAVVADVVAGPLPGQFDAAVLCRFTNILSPTDVGRALRHVHDALVSGGAIYLLTIVLDDSRVSPAASTFTDVMMLNIYDEGRAYTEGEYRAWLAAAGFAAIERIDHPGAPPILIARKPA